MLDLQEILSKKDDHRIGKTGYVALLGRPNTGKSTLLNTVLHRHLAAVSPKPQTTRKYLLGIYTDDNSQILFLDAPGIHSGKIAIDEAMDASIRRVMHDADVVVCMVDPTREPGAEDGLAVAAAVKSKKPVIIAINKNDVAKEEQVAASLEFYRKSLPDAPVVRIVALDIDKVQSVLTLIKERLPEGPFLYSDDEMTDVYERDVAAELIRETLLEELKQEVPHCAAVTIDSWKEAGSRISIEATLNVEREGHRGIILGQGGSMIKHIRECSTAKIAEFCGARINLRLFVKVVPDWRNRKRFLKDIRLMD
ncbi:MAG: GTPase Era [Victivallales bacterium]|nr:GTPase Era [Victivallales bacterium]